MRRASVVSEQGSSIKLGPLTPDRLKEYPGLGDLSNEEAKLAVDAIQKLTILLFEMLKNSEIIRHGESRNL